MMVDAVEIRMFSRRPRLPVDEIRPEHQVIHDELTKWGAWSRERRGGRSSCGSMEGNYQIRWRDWHYPSAEEMMPNLANPRMVVVDKAVLKVPEKNRDFLRSYYVKQTRPEIICRVQCVNFTNFRVWMDDSRWMVINVLKRAAA